MFIAVNQVKLIDSSLAKGSHTSPSPSSGIAQISVEQQPAAIKIEVSIGAHMVFPLSLGIGRENRWEFMCLQTWKGLMEL